MLNNPNRIGIWGYGREGRASLLHLRTLYPDAHITVIDSLPQEIDGVRVLVGDAGEQAIASGEFGLIIKSPGISLYKPAVLQAQEKGTKFTSATNLWFAMHPTAKKIVVTGTKGKSTTSSLIHHLLMESGYKSALAGNIGVPLLSMQPGEDVTVLELSSYQIADLLYAPDVAVLLNLYPEHADWHGSVDRYYSDKTRIASLNTSMPIVSNEAIFITRGHFIRYDEFPPYEGMPEFFIGAHNRKNLGAALAAINTAGFKVKDLLGALHSYKPLPHRQEVIGDINGVRWINDSISTVPETAMAALAMHTGKPVTLILGGQDRGQDYTTLAAAIQSHGHVRVITLPDNGPRIAQAIPSTPCETLAQAIDIAARETPMGGVVLLSPAAPSYGRFKNFEDRGNQFRDMVLALNN